MTITELNSKHIQVQHVSDELARIISAMNATQRESTVISDKAGVNMGVAIEEARNLLTEYASVINGIRNQTKVPWPGKE